MISEKRLPPESKVLFTEPTLWEEYKGRIIAILSILLCQAGLIVALLLNLKRRRRTESELRQTQQSVSLAVEAVQLGMLTWETSNPEMSASEKWKEIHGYGPTEQVTFQNFLSRVHPDDKRVVEHSIKDAIARKGVFIVQHRLILPDSRIRWISKNGRVEAMGNNGDSRVLGIAIDITDQVIAERASHELNSRLIGAQEDERKRIARDLHDDLSQRLALLSMEADQLGRMDHAPASQPLIEEIRMQLKNLSSEIRNLFSRIASRPTRTTRISCRDSRLM